MFGANYFGQAYFGQAYPQYVIVGITYLSSGSGGTWKDFADRPQLDLLFVAQVGDQEITELIQGKVPGSIQELWTSKALERLKVQFFYQYPVDADMGRIRGSKFVDFMVVTVPLMTGIELFGGYWHEGELGADDRRRQTDIEEALRDRMRVPMTILWAGDMIDEDTIYEKLKGVL